MTLFLGVDAGNTKTVAIVADEAGRIQGAGRSGCGDIYGAGLPGRAFASVKEAVLTALSTADASLADVSAAGLSMAGVDWPEDYDWWYDTLRREGLGSPTVVVNDAIGGLCAGSRTLCGISIVIGTDTAIGARGLDGKLWHASFWLNGYCLHDMASQALRAGYGVELGFDEPTSLASRLPALFGVATPGEVLHALTSREHQVRRPTGKIVSILLVEASHGDAVSVGIVERFANRYGDFALTAARHVGLVDAAHTSPVPLVFSGGLTRHPSTLFWDMIENRINQSMPVVAVHSPHEPVVGALLLAYHEAHMDVTDLMMEQIASTSPESAFFATE